MEIDVTSRPSSKQIIFSGTYFYSFTVNSYHVMLCNGNASRTGLGEEADR